MRRTLLLTLICASLLTASLLYGEPYVYDYWKNAVPTPSFYRISTQIDGASLGIGPFSEPRDLFVSASGDIYIADTGNDRIVILDRRGDLKQTITTFGEAAAGDGFLGPEGIFVDADDSLYIADTGNKRIVVLSGSGDLLKIIEAPRSDILRPEYTYLPSKLAVDKAGRIYVTGPGMFEGIMEFDQDGGFSGFLGSNRVDFRLDDYIWKIISTREQREGMSLFIPEEFSNLDIDSLGFIYSVTQNEDAQFPVKKHNAEGADVLQRNGFFDPVGDVAPNSIGTITGPSTFIDVAVDANDIYHCLDSKRMRIFSYNREGQLLVAFGGPGNRAGSFVSPAALDTCDGDLLVLDAGSRMVSRFKLTEYGRSVREAMYRHGNGEYEMAASLWRYVLERNANYELAYSGLGRILYRQGEYAEALDLFRTANDRQGYSKTFERRRRIVLRETFGILMTSALLLIAGIAVLRRIGLISGSRDRLEYASARLPLYKRLKFGLYILRHPFDGFWDLKHNSVGTTASAAIMLLLFIAVNLIRTQFSGFLFNTTDMSGYNLLEEVIKIILPVGLFTLGNWSLTSLMEGEGTMRDIFIAAAYALVPMIIILPLTTILSSLLTLDEASILHVIETFAYCAALGLLFVGNMTVHNYTAGKTIAVSGLTILAVGIILFLSLLFITFVGQVWGFSFSIFKEIAYRIQ